MTGESETNRACDSTWRSVKGARRIEDMDEASAMVVKSSIASAVCHCDVMSHSNHYPEESYALTENGQLHDTNKYHAARYQDGSSIDWLYEEALERERTQAQRSQHGVRGLLLPWIDSARMWLVVILTGIGIGLAGAWLDVLVKWYVAFLSCLQAMKLSRLGDLREGRCTYGFFYNQNTCCSGLDRTRHTFALYDHV